MRARIAVLMSPFLAICLWTLPSLGTLSPETTVGWNWDQVTLHPTRSGEIEVRVDGAMLVIYAGPRKRQWARLRGLKRVEAAQSE